jgi:hypothetical protein
MGRKYQILRRNGICDDFVLSDGVSFSNLPRGFEIKSGDITLPYSKASVTENPLQLPPLTSKFSPFPSKL